MPGTPSPQGVLCTAYEQEQEEHVLMNQQRLCPAAVPAAVSPLRRKSWQNYARKPHNDASLSCLNDMIPDICDHYLADPYGRCPLEVSLIILCPVCSFSPFGGEWQGPKKGRGTTGHHQTLTQRDFRSPIWNSRSFKLLCLY